MNCITCQNWDIKTLNKKIKCNKGKWEINIDDKTTLREKVILIKVKTPCSDHEPDECIKQIRKEVIV